MTLHDPAGGGQADARALELLGSMKPLEDPKELARMTHVESGSVVPDEDRDLPVVGTTGTHFDRRVLDATGVFHRIVESRLVDRLLQHLPITADRREGATCQRIFRSW